MTHENLSSENLEHLKSVASAINQDYRRVLAVGIWGDAAPFNRDRSKSLEMISMNFQGIGELSLRIPLVAIPKDFCLKNQKTYDQLMELLAWSFEHLILGEHPKARHDKTRFRKSDTSRKKMAGQQLQRACVCEVRGDWCFYKHQLRLPGWRDKAGCCWKCNMTTDRLGECSSQAAWKKPDHRLTHHDVMAGILAKNQSISPLFAIPFLTVDNIKIDWLHCMDLGVAADYLGSLFSLLLTVLPGASQTERCNALFTKIREYYARTGSESKLPKLVPTMIKKDKAPFPKLRAKAGEVRDLILFAKEAADELLGDSVEHASVKACSHALWECYECLRVQTFNTKKFQDACQRFALLYIGVHEFSKAHDLKRWPLKPKFHLFLELGFSTSSSPVKTWTYRDESFGGFVAGVSGRRGGKFSPLSVGQSFFDRVAALEPVPAL